MSRTLRPIMLGAGIVAPLLGMLWIGQGLGYIHWPKSSFMLDQRVWADYGAGLAVCGLLLMLVARRMR